MMLAMKAYRLVLCFFLISTYCWSQTHNGSPEVNPKSIQKNFENWFKYQSSKIMLSTDFIGLDVKKKNITKDLFFQKLKTGNYIPIRLVPNNNIVYQLFKIDSKADTSIKATILQLAFDEYEHFKMEGKVFAKFDYSDLNGNEVTNESMKGKYVIIKCWYIHCAACIEEFPMVNLLAEKYKDHTDILFLSLAEDTPAQLNAFLAKKPLSYRVVPNMKIYMNQVLHLNGFPTHFIIDKEGKILKVVSNFESLNSALERLLKD
jgi:thiol-disulfide isomerase/thioredoxin